MVQNFIPIFCSISDKTVEQIAARHSDGKEFNVNHYTEKSMVEMILGSSFDIFTQDIEEDGDKEIDRVVEAVKL
jgi:hypothetical protein